MEVWNRNTRRAYLSLLCVRDDFYIAKGYEKSVIVFDTIITITILFIIIISISLHSCVCWVEFDASNLNINYFFSLSFSLPCVSFSSFHFGLSVCVASVFHSSWCLMMMMVRMMMVMPLLWLRVWCVVCHFWNSAKNGTLSLTHWNGSLPLLTVNHSLLPFFLSFSLYLSLSLSLSLLDTFLFTCDSPFNFFASITTAALSFSPYLSFSFSLTFVKGATTQNGENWPIDFPSAQFES